MVCFLTPEFSVEERPRIPTDKVRFFGSGPDHSLVPRNPVPSFWTAKQETGSGNDYFPGQLRGSLPLAVNRPDHFVKTRVRTMGTNRTQQTIHYCRTTTSPAKPVKTALTIGAHPSEIPPNCVMHPAINSIAAGNRSKRVQKPFHNSL